MRRGRVEEASALAQKLLNRWSPKFVLVTVSDISTTMQNFIQIGLGVSVLRMRDFAHLGTNFTVLCHFLTFRRHNFFTAA